MIAIIENNPINHGIYTLKDWSQFSTKTGNNRSPGKYGLLELYSIFTFHDGTTEGKLSEDVGQLNSSRFGLGHLKTNFGAFEGMVNGYI